MFEKKITLLEILFCYYWMNKDYLIYYNLIKNPRKGIGMFYCEISIKTFLMAFFLVQRTQKMHTQLSQLTKAYN